MQGRRAKRPIWIAGIAAYLILRWALLFHPGYVADVNAYKRWALRAAQSGIAQIYQTSDMDYPPLYAWILYPLGKAAQAIDPEGSAAMRDARHLTFLVKLPPLLFDLALGWLLWRLGRHTARLRPKGPPWGAILPAAYLLHPAVVFDTAYWGQPDSIHSVFVLAAFLALGMPEIFQRPAQEGTPSRIPRTDGPAAPGVTTATDRPSPAGAPKRPVVWPAWVLLSLATLMKPLGAPFFPLLLVLSLWWRGLRATLVGIAAAAATTLAVFFPFVLAGQLGAAIHRVVGDVQLMPNTSSNAHNLWWIYGAWKPAGRAVLGPLTLTHVGLLLFLLVFAALIHRIWRLHGHHERPTPAQGLLLALGISLAFFQLSTHLHENHMFLAIPLSLALLPLAPSGDRSLRWLAAGLGLGLLINLALHDLVLPRRFPFTLGGSSGVMNLHLKRPFFVAELVVIWIGTLLNVGLFAWYLWKTLRPGKRSWFEMLGAGSPRRVASR